MPFIPPPTMFGFISVAPTGPVNLGNVPVGVATPVTFTVTASGNESSSWNAVLVNPPVGWSINVVGPGVLQPGQKGTFIVTLNQPSGSGPTSVVVKVTGGSTHQTFNITINATVIGTGGAGGGGGSGGGGIPSASPVVLVFPNTVGLTSSQPLPVVISNIGTQPFIINSISLGTGVNFSIFSGPTKFYHSLFQMVKKVVRRVNFFPSPQPLTRQWFPQQDKKQRVQWKALPMLKGDFPLLVPVGSSFAVLIVFTPTALGLLVDVLNILTSLGSTPFQVVVEGNGVLVSPVSILTGATRGILFAFQDVSGAASLLSLQPNNLNSDQLSDVVFNGVVWGAPTDEKSIMRAQIRYDDLGPAVIEVTSTTKRPQAGVTTPQVVTDIIDIGTVAADGSRLTAFADITQTGEDIEISVVRQANAGPVSIIDITPYFEPRGEKVEST